MDRTAEISLAICTVRRLGADPSQAPACYVSSETRSAKAISARTTDEVFDSMFRGWGGEVDRHENATLDQRRETAAGESGADEIEQGFPCLVRR